jgi:hypothetical protein
MHERHTAKIILNCKRLKVFLPYYQEQVKNLGMVVHICNSYTQETDSGGSQG